MLQRVREPRRSTWTSIGNDPMVRHIRSLDARGVALAAIQAENARLLARSAESDRRP